MPTNAADIKQFWYPRWFTHGVILLQLAWEDTNVEEKGGLPIAHGKRHGVPNQDHACHCVPAQLPVAVDQVVDAQRDAACVRQR